jgi:hypothetical protein
MELGKVRAVYGFIAKDTINGEEPGRLETSLCEVVQLRAGTVLHKLTSATNEQKGDNKLGERKNVSQNVFAVIEAGMGKTNNN